MPAGAAYGLAVFVVSAFVGLPVSARITNAGTTISDMASMVGWATFAVEHIVFGIVLSTIALGTTSTGGHTATVGATRSAMLSR